MEDDDHQKRLEIVTSDSYPDNISSYDTNPVEDGRPTNKGTPYDALHITFSGEGRKIRTWKLQRTDMGRRPDPE